MEMPSNENSQPLMNSTSDADNQHETIVPDGLNNAYALLSLDILLYILHVF